MNVGRFSLKTACLVLAVVYLASNSPCVSAGCVGDAPTFGDLTLSCIDDYWQSVGSIVITNCSSSRVNGPTIINGNLTMDYRSLLTYEPPSLSASPLITVKGCVFFNQSYMRINLTRERNVEMIYAQNLKQKNHWLYLMPIESSCPTMDVTSLNFQSEIHWDNGVAINSTLIDSKKTKITFLTVEPGHSGIQLGFLSGSPSSSQTWFPALLAIIGCFILIVLVGETISCITARSVDKKVAKLDKMSINDDSSVSLLDDTE